MDLKQHLKTLVEQHGPSGFEAPVGRVIQEAWSPLVDSLEIGKSGSLIALKRGTQTDSSDGTRRRIMLCAHMDEIGMIVREVRGTFLKVSRLGGIDARILPGLPILVHGREPVPGLIGIVPQPTLSSENQGVYAALDDLYVDLCLPPERVAALVRVGDPITVDLPMIELGNGLLVGKAMDDRACVAAITVCLEQLQSRKHEWDVLAVAAVQEETGSRGAAVEAYHLQPDIAIALDVTYGQQPGVSGADVHKLGGNPPLSLGANFHPALFEAIKAASERLELTLPIDPLPGHSGTDAWVIQTAREGIPSALLNIPIRNMHTAIETVDLKDIERAGRVLTEFITGLKPDFLSAIQWDKAPSEKDSQEGEKKDE
ncbi:MAG: M20/M25/M40 family metallo-hydrolase [Anaerolineae bacterium]|nr:M20/M25/M40 family metallo-hydrolase [Anaerolineae bacterium]